MHRVCPQCRTEYGSDVVVCPNDGATLMDQLQTTDSLIGIVLADRYRVIRTLGEGGMGRVYLAEHVRMGRMSAVKVMSPSLAPTPDAISRFNREAANASRINHPNVAAIYDFGETAEGVLYLAMEYVEGETLAAMLRRMGPLPPAHAGELVRQIAEALHAAHQLGIVHRDLKPDNILIAHDSDGRERVKVVDFGIAKTTQGGGQTLTTVGMSIGTPEYMSPEQLAGDALDARTDIYSLGLVAIKMLTGELAYPDITSKQSLVQRLTTRPRPLSEMRPEVAWPPRLQQALDKALSPEPHDRYSTVGEFALDVVAATGASAAQAQGRTRAMTPMGVPGITTQSYEVVDERVRRRRPVVAAAAIVAAISAVVLLWSSRATDPVQGGGASAPAAAAQADSPSALQKPASPVAPPVSSPSVVALESAAPLAERSIPAGVPAMTGSTAGGAVGAAALRTAVDSAAIDPPTTFTDRTRTSAANRRLGTHAWLRASGDSASEALPAGSAVDQAREVLGHINRARQLFATRQLPKASAELRVAHEEFALFAAGHPGSRETQTLRQQLTLVSRDALAACHAARDSAAVTGRRAIVCTPLERFVAQQDQVGRGAARLRNFPGRRQRP